MTLTSFNGANESERHFGTVEGKDTMPGQGAQEMTVGDLAAELGLSRAAVYKRISKLRERGLVEVDSRSNGRLSTLTDDQIEAIVNYRELMQDGKTAQTQDFSASTDGVNELRNTVDQLTQTVERLTQELAASEAARTAAVEELTQLRIQVDELRQENRQYAAKILEYSDRFAQLADQAQKLQAMSAQTRRRRWLPWRRRDDDDNQG